MNSGVIAVGDSVTNACSRDLAIGGLDALSWAQRVADGIGQPLTVHARPGASSATIRRELLPQIDGRYSLGLVYVGINNVTSWRAWRREDLAEDLSVIVARVAEVADRVLVMGYPSTLGQARTVWPYGPGLGARLRDANRTVERAAAQSATLVQCPPLGGDEVWVDGVHPTSLGHHAMAQAALGALGVTLPPPAPVSLAPAFRAWRRRESVRFALSAPPRGVGKWLLTPHG